MFTYLREREQERARAFKWGEAEREGDRIRSKLQALSCQNRAPHGTQTHKLWDHDLSWSWTLNRQSHPGTPPLAKHLKICLMFIYFWENKRDRETEHEQGRGREREGDTESEAGSRLWAVSPELDTGLEPTDCEIMTWAKVRCLTNWASQVPR